MKCEKSVIRNRKKISVSVLVSMRIRDPAYVSVRIQIQGSDDPKSWESWQFKKVIFLYQKLQITHVTSTLQEKPPAPKEEQALHTTFLHYFYRSFCSIWIRIPSQLTKINAGSRRIRIHNTRKNAVLDIIIKNKRSVPEFIDPRFRENKNARIQSLKTSVLGFFSRKLGL